MFDIHHCSALRDLQTYGVPPLANKFRFFRGVDRQSRTGLISILAITWITVSFNIKQALRGSFAIAKLLIKNFDCQRATTRVRSV